MNKYVLLSEGKVCSGGKTLFRIRAEKDIPSQHVKKGDLGGLVHDIKNLPQSGTSWISKGAQVLGEACVIGNARVGGNAIVKGNSEIAGHVKVSGSAELEDVRINGFDVEIRERAVLKNVSFIGNNVLIHGFAHLENVKKGSQLGDFEMSGRSIISSSGDMLEIDGSYVVIKENARIENVSSIKAVNLVVAGDAVVENGVTIDGEDISITDCSHVTGRLVIGDNFSISDVASLKRGLVNALPFKNISITGDTALSTNAFEPPYDPFGGI